MAKKAVEPEESAGTTELVSALVQAIEATRPMVKKTALTRKKNTPWTPKDGSPRAKLKRKMYHHGLLIGHKISNQEIELLNKVKPGVFCDGHVKVTRRRDRGIDIDYPIKTAAQKLKLVNQFGIRSFSELLERLINEADNPVKFKSEEDLD